MENGQAFNQTKFIIDVFNQIEWPWQNKQNDFPLVATNNTYQVVCNVYVKWNRMGDTTCTI